MPSRRPDSEHHAILRLEYDGGAYHGWSRQPGGLRTVEGDLLTAFEELECGEVSLRCAGRTDAGVHATGQIADARYRSRITPDHLAAALGSRLDAALSVVASVPAPPGFDARADATSRAYEYRVLHRRAPSPLRARHVLHHPRRLDLPLLDAAAAAALGQHEFTAFTPSRSGHRYFARTILTSRWTERGDELVYEVRANAFMRHMVRSLVGTMLAVGRGDLALEEFVAMLDGGRRPAAAATAPAHGLCFVDVTWEPLPGVAPPPRWRAGRADAAAVPFSPPG